MLFAENLLSTFILAFRMASVYGNFPFYFDKSSKKCIPCKSKSFKYSKFRLVYCAILILGNTLQVLFLKSTLKQTILLQSVYILISIYVLFYSQFSLFKKRNDFIRIINGFMDFECKFVKNGT